MAWIGCQWRAWARADVKKPSECRNNQEEQLEDNRHDYRDDHDSVSSTESSLLSVQSHTDVPQDTQGMQSQTQGEGSQNHRILEYDLPVDFLAFLAENHNPDVSWSEELNNHNRNSDEVHGVVEECMALHVQDKRHCVYLTLPNSVNVGDKLEVQAHGVGRSWDEAIDAACLSAFAVLLLNHPYDVRFCEEQAWKCATSLVREKAHFEKDRLLLTFALAEERKGNVKDSNIQRLQETGSRWCSLGLAPATFQFLKSQQNEFLYTPSPFDSLASTPQIVADCMRNKFRHLFAEDEPFETYQAQVSKYIKNSMFMHVKSDLPNARERLANFLDFLQEPELYKRFIIVTTSDHTIQMTEPEWEYQVELLFDAMLGYPLENFTLLAVFTKPSLTEFPAASFGTVQSHHHEYTSREKTFKPHCNARLCLASLQLQGRVNGARITNHNDAAALLAILRENSCRNAEALRTNATTSSQSHSLWNRRSDMEAARRARGSQTNTSRMPEFNGASHDRKCTPTQQVSCERLPDTCFARWPFVDSFRHALINSEFIDKLEASRASFYIQWIAENRQFSFGVVNPELVLGFTPEIYNHGLKGFQALNARYKQWALKVDSDKSYHILTVAERNIRELWVSVAKRTTCQH